jgi:2-polyprenyl-3-methyl-5-hydroxy-6-metoxy-1,4-benzoquinol methylase
MVRCERTIQEWTRCEAEEMNLRLKDSRPFGRPDFEFSEEDAWFWEDYAYKKGRRCDRGNLSRKFLELLDLDSVKGKRVLDIGCGSGQYAVLLAQKGAIVTGIDLSPVGIELAQKMAAVNGVADRCTFSVAQFSESDFPNEHFDIVYMHEVYHHAIKYLGIKEEVNRIAKPGAKILLAETIRGGPLLHAGRTLTKSVKYLVDPESKIHDLNEGGETLSLQDYKEFADGFAYHEIHLMSFFYMIKLVLKKHTHSFLVRSLLRTAKYMDDATLTVFPFLRKHCAEAVLYIEK